MELLTEEILSKFESHPIRSQDGKGLDAEVLVKYFNPCGRGTWLITEGYCRLFEWEWGYLMLSELQSIRLPFGMAIERDMCSHGRYVRDFLTQE